VKRDAFMRLEKLIADGVIELIWFGTTGDAFLYAKKFMDRCCCSTGFTQDNISPMDALIVADAIIDNQCHKIYTTDNNLLFNKDLHDMIDEIRNSRYPSAPELKFLSFERSAPEPSRKRAGGRMVLDGMY